MSFLTQANLSRVQSLGVNVPAYRREKIQTGVVHFGPGAFHRVHQACFLDAALATDPRWGICEVALQSSGVRDALAPQDGLYTLAILDAQADFRIIGSIKQLLVAHESPPAVLKRLIDPQVKLVTATITEKGYCLNADGALDTNHADVQYDLQNPSAPKTFVGYLVEALRQRRANGIAPPNILSCDNLADNGKRLQCAVIELAQRRDVSLAAWIATEVPFPCTMIDSITPATDDSLRSLVSERIGLVDRWPVQRESFSQWVIEDTMRGVTPDWAALGVSVTNDIAGYERSKLRLLNGAHSTLAYLGSLAGYETVAQAIGDVALLEFVSTMMACDIAPTIAAPPGLDLANYSASILQRFRNPAMRHLLAQIAWDGSQKIPIRLLGTVADNLASGRSVSRLVIPLAAWMHFIRRKSARHERAVDPLATRLEQLGAACNGNAQHDVQLYLTLDHMFNHELRSSRSFVAELETAYRKLDRVDNKETLEHALRS